MTEGDQSTDLAARAMRHAARRWFVRLRHEDIKPAEYAEFMRWLNAKPAHAAAFQAVEQLWGELDGIREPILARFPRISPQTRRMPGWSGWALAACLAVVVAALGLQYRTTLEPNSVATAQTAQLFSAPRGEVRQILLADGSRITLAPGSILRATIDGARRKTVLQKGEALFEVAHDPAHPFVVEAGAARITVLGTVFDTRLTSQLTQVTVHSGRVQLATPQAHALILPGQRGRVSSGHLVEPEAVNLNATLGWQQGVQVFEREPLGDVLADLNRFDDRLLTLADPALAQIPVSGVFRQGSLDDFINALGQSVPLTVQAIAGGYRLAAVAR